MPEIDFFFFNSSTSSINFFLIILSLPSQNISGSCEKGLGETMCMSHSMCQVGFPRKHTLRGGLVCRMFIRGALDICGWEKKEAGLVTGKCQATMQVWRQTQLWPRWSFGTKMTCQSWPLLSWNGWACLPPNQPVIVGCPQLSAAEVIPEILTALPEVVAVSPSLKGALGDGGYMDLCPSHKPLSDSLYN